ncbi:hypothetical protein NQ318_013914, partial [Aromia moschata]
LVRHGDTEVTLKGTRFESVEAVKAKAKEVLNQLTETTSSTAFNNGKVVWELCRDRQGEYIEGEKVATEFSYAQFLRYQYRPIMVGHPVYLSARSLTVPFAFQVTTGENDLDKDEVNIISGALELRKKTVSEVMTKIEDVFMLDYEAILDFETVSEIMKSGYSRVPVYDGNRQNIVTVGPEKCSTSRTWRSSIPTTTPPLKTLCQFYQNPCNFVFEDVTLDVMFKIFKEGNKGHMAFVHRVNNEGEGDPFYETIGLITLEDVIEELIQAEIMDETDVFTANVLKSVMDELLIMFFLSLQLTTAPRGGGSRREDRTSACLPRNEGEPYKVRISPQLTLAAFQFLSTSVEPFQPNVISETILRRLLKQDIVLHIKKNKEWRVDPANVIYNQGKPVDFFVIILEGRVEVTVGKENLVFEGGPFTYFGTQALVQTVGIGESESPSVAPSTLGSLESLNIDSILRHTFIPDYTVRACTEVLYLKIKRSLYLAAKRATLMERSKKGGEQQSEQQFDEEVDKILHYNSIGESVEADSVDLIHKDYYSPADIDFDNG